MVTRIPLLVGGSIAIIIIFLDTVAQCHCPGPCRVHLPQVGLVVDRLRYGHPVLSRPVEASGRLNYFVDRLWSDQHSHWRFPIAVLVLVVPQLFRSTRSASDIH